MDLIKSISLCSARASNHVATMSLTFHWAQYSTAEITAAVLDELEHGLSAPLAKRVEHSFKTGELQSPSYLAINPCGRVPAIVHEGTAIFESAAITMYLGEVFGVDRKDANGDELESLYPTPGPRRGEAMKWIVWSNLALAEAWSRLAATMGIGGGAAGMAKVSEEDRKARAESARKDLLRWLGVLNGALEGKQYLLGEKYSLADTHVYSFVGWMPAVGVELDGYENTKGWFERVGGRPALKSNHMQN